MADETPQSERILYQTEDGRTRIQCRFENETIWLTQRLMADLFQKNVRTINEHIQNVFAEAELSPDSVIRKFRITAAAVHQDVQLSGNSGSFDPRMSDDVPSRATCRQKRKTATRFVDGLLPTTTCCASPPNGRQRTRLTNHLTDA